jgi:hypothetical protein
MMLRRSKQIGVGLYGKGFATEADARGQDEIALKKLLADLAKPEGTCGPAGVVIFPRLLLSEVFGASPNGHINNAEVELIKNAWRQRSPAVEHLIQVCPFHPLP